MSDQSSILPERTPLAAARKAADEASRQPGPPHRGVDAAVRVVLGNLREQRQHAPGESFGHLISVVPVAAIDALLKEIGDA